MVQLALAAPYPTAMVSNNHSMDPSVRGELLPIPSKGTWRTMPYRNIKIPQRIKGDIRHLVPACTDLPPNPFLMGTSLTLLMACSSTSFQFYSMFLVQMHMADGWEALEWSCLGSQQCHCSRSALGVTLLAWGLMASHPGAYGPRRALVRSMCWLTGPWQITLHVLEMELRI